MNAPRNQSVKFSKNLTDPPTPMQVPCMVDHPFSVVGRALGIPLVRVNQITEMVPDELKITISKALEKNITSA